MKCAHKNTEMEKLSVSTSGRIDVLVKCLDCGYTTWESGGYLFNNKDIKENVHLLGKKISMGCRVTDTSSCSICGGEMEEERVGNLCRGK